MQDVSGDPAAAAAEFEIVMRGLDPRIHGAGRARTERWIAVSSTAMTAYQAARRRPA
jgi:hypothetical protein